MEKPNVLMIYEYLPPIKGGIENHVQELMFALKNYNVIMLTRNPSVKPSYEKVGNVKIYRISGNRLMPLRYLYAGMRLSKHEKISLIHAHTLTNPAMVAVTLGILLNCPTVVTIHESQFILDMKNDKLISKIKYRFLIKIAKSIITTSDELRKYAVSLTKHFDKVVEIPNGVNIKAFAPRLFSPLNIINLCDNKKIILCPRRITPKNGIIYLIESIPMVLQKHLSVKFIFAGPVCDSNYFLSIKKRVSELKIEESVEFLGPILYDKMPLVYAFADVVVIPSLIEAISLAALEAMASKKPIIATKVGGLLEIIKNGYNGTLVDPADSQALANAIIFLLEQQRGCQKICREWVCSQTNSLGIV